MKLFGEEKPEQIEILGKTLQCQVCSHTYFWRREVQLHSAVATFFKLDWTEPSADCYVCSNCGYLHWFLPLKS